MILNIPEGFWYAGENVLDDRDRITLGKAITPTRNFKLENKLRYAMFVNTEGQIILQPMVSVDLSLVATTLKEDQAK